MVNYNKVLDEDGVALISNCIGLDIMEAVRLEYDEINEKAVRTQIEKDKPVIVLWKHVVGESKRLTNFSNILVYGV